MTEAFPTFAAAVAERLEQGSKTYGDRSFKLPPALLTNEIEQELLDVCAWSFILWCHVHGLRANLTEPTRMATPARGGCQ